MSKIANVRLQNAGAQYDPSQINQLVRSLEQIVLQLNSAYTSTVDNDNIGALGFFGAGGHASVLDGTENFFLPYASFIDRTTQTAATINTAYALPLEIEQLSSGVYRDPGNTSRVYVDVPGVYNIQFSAQLQKTSGGAATAFIWFRVNGQNIGASATKITVQGSSAAAVLLAEAATAFCPSIPSLILTVTYVSSISEIGPSSSFPVSGVSGTGRVGTVSVIPSLSFSVSGVSGTGNVGTVNVTV